jgi:hypothetical protein
MHLYVEQSPDCTSADLRSGNLDFSGPTLTSFDHWTLAHWTGRVQDGKRILLRNRETYGRMGWNNDAVQQNILGRALRGREDYVEIGVNHAQIKAYVREANKDEAWRKLGETLIAEEVASLKAKAQRYAKPTVYVYGLEGGDTMEGRIAALSTKEVEERAAQFGLTFECDIEAMREIVRDGYAKYNDPKKVKARESASKRGSLTKLRKLVTEAFDGKYHLGRGRPNSRAQEIIDAAFAKHPVEAEKLMRTLSEKLAIIEQSKNFHLLNPYAGVVLEQRQYGGTTKYVTPEQWIAGEKGTIEHDWSGPTYVRKEGDRVVTSRGAEVPFKDAVRLYQYAAQWRAKNFPFGKAWQSVGGQSEAVRVGHFQLNEIDAEGNARVGCHRLDFMEMERLAIKEVPHLVKARYPLPAIVTTYQPNEAEAWVEARP